MLAATSDWGGYRWGPQRLPEATVVALPEARAFTSGETPHPVGLIGQNRSRRGGDGSEFFAIRPFQPGDRLRRVNWRTTLRTGEVHAVGTTAQEDSSVLLLLDATSDVGASDGLDGEASALDVAVRAASALAAHHIRVGDRVALRVLGDQPGTWTGFRGQAPATAAGAARRGAAGLAGPAGGATPPVPGRRGHGGPVLSPMLTPEVTTVMVTLARRGLTVVVVDTLTPEILPEPAQNPRTAARLAWRLRLMERQMQITEVTRRGIPVVLWHGPGTLDEVLRRLARRSRMPKVMSR